MPPSTPLAKLQRSRFLKKLTPSPACSESVESRKTHTDKVILDRWFDRIVDNTNFDQTAIETSNGKDFWIHVSCQKNIKKNRHQVIRNLVKK